MNTAKGVTELCDSLDPSRHCLFSELILFILFILVICLRNLLTVGFTYTEIYIASLTQSLPHVSHVSNFCSLCQLRAMRIESCQNN